MIKRSLTLSGHRTSIALEQAFWDALNEMADDKQISLIALIHDIDRKRAEAPLASSLRVAALKWYKEKNS